ncbi:acyltransferase family protein [Croceibacterium ferulae]|uniref:acyltransferase family protein n=1 Tax=Croceibacterium ferulae TaxID=1854641 RepID=UPI000EB2A9ED|nr:acyltransferase [Croceibacterium ferulae]
MVASREALARLPDGGRFIALDSLRGVAAIAVMLFHMGPFGWLAGAGFLRNGWLMVDFFFVLSGFVIAASYGERLAQGFSRRQFLALRLGRVVPLHVAAVLAASAFELFYVHGVLGERSNPLLFWRGLLLLDGFATGANNHYAPVSWSISVEIVLYAIAATLFGRGRRGLTLAALLVGGCVAALALEWNHPGLGRLLQRGMLGFGLGVGCHWLHRRWHGQIGASWLTLLEVASLAALVWLLAAMPLGNSTLLLTSPVFAATVLIFARDKGWVSRLLQLRPLIVLGTLSYSIYMLHMLLIRPLAKAGPAVLQAMGRPDLVATDPRPFGLGTLALDQGAATIMSLVMIALTVGLSALSFRWLEEPARRWSRDHARRWGAGAAEREALTI